MLKHFISTKLQHFIINNNDESYKGDTMSREHSSLDNYTVYDPYTFIRFNDNYSKITRENIIEITSLVNSLQEPQHVKRTSLNMLKQYVLGQKKEGKRVLIRDRELFVKTAIYYSRIINGLPATKPPKLHKNLKNWFFTEYLTKHPEVKKKFFKNKLNPQNLVYATLTKTIINKHPEIELEAYKISYILGRTLKKYGYFTTKPQLSFAVLTYYISKKTNNPVNIKLLSKMFNTSDAYITVLATKNKNKLEKIYNGMMNEDIQTIINSLTKIIEKIQED